MGPLEIIAIILAVVGVVGCILPGLPGLPLNAVSLLLVYIAESTGRGGEPMSLGFLIAWVIVTVIVSLLDYVLPAKMTKWTGGHKEASQGAMLGMIIGIFFTPIGMLMGSLLGAFLCELKVQGQDAFGAAKAAIGVFIGFILSTGLKTILSVIMLIYTLIYIF